MPMNSSKYVVIADCRDDNYWVLQCLEKNFKLVVQRSYDWLEDQSLYHYEFFHLDDGQELNIISYQGYEYYAFKKNIMLADNDAAATWFLKDYLGYAELAYFFQWLEHEVGDHYKDETKPAEPFDTDRFFDDDAIIHSTIYLNRPDN